jgi:type II secretory pathway component PulC
LLKTDWTVYGYDLGNSEHDAVVTCTFATANATRATLIVYSDDAIQGGIISNRLAQEFYAQNERLEAEWLDEAYKRFGF